MKNPLNLPLHAISWSSQLCNSFLDANLTTLDIKVYAAMSLSCNLKTGKSHPFKVPSLVQPLCASERGIYKSLSLLSAGGHIQIERDNGIIKCTMPGVAYSYQIVKKAKRLKYVTKRLSDSPLPDRLTTWNKEVNRPMSGGQREYLLNQDLPDNKFIEYTARAKCGLLRYERKDPLYYLSWCKEYFSDICQADCNSTEIKFLIIASLNMDLESGDSHWLNVEAIADRLGVKTRCIYKCLASLDAKDLLDIKEAGDVRVHLPGVKRTTEKMVQVGVAVRRRRREAMRRNQPFCKEFEDAVGRKPSMGEIENMEAMKDRQRAEYIVQAAKRRAALDEFNDLHDKLAEA